MNKTKQVKFKRSFITGINKDSFEYEVLKRIKKDKEIYVNVTHVSKSGMSRDMQFFIVINNKIQNITYFVAKWLDMNYRDDKYGSRVIRFNGCGMDMTYHAVYNVSSVLFKDGYAINKSNI